MAAVGHLGFLEVGILTVIRPYVALQNLVPICRATQLNSTDNYGRRYLTPLKDRIIMI